jgi:hypothetical protein
MACRWTARLLQALIHDPAERTLVQVRVNPMLVLLEEAHAPIMRSPRRRSFDPPAAQ